jgi:hypothetical protein
MTVAFADLAGGSAPFSAERVAGIDFQIVPPADAEWTFDVWIDDVSWGAGDGTGAGGSGAGGDTGAAGAGGGG